MFVKRLQQMDTSTLARQVYEKQLKLRLPGLASEVKTICETLCITDINMSNVSKEKVEETIFYHHYADMKEIMKSSKNMENIRHEDF